MLPFYISNSSNACLIIYQGVRLPVMKKRTSKVQRVEEEGALCCCEYMNRHGERSHVAACCCDCEDVDDACDR